jgi:hypothetical protein
MPSFLSFFDDLFARRKVSTIIGPISGRGLGLIGFRFFSFFVGADYAGIYEDLDEYLFEAYVKGATEGHKGLF